MKSLFGVVELLTLSPRRPEPAFEITRQGMHLLSDQLLPVGTLVLAVLALPGAKLTHDVIVRVAWAHGKRMSVEFVLPDEALLEEIARVRDRFSVARHTETTCAN